MCSHVLDPVLTDALKHQMVNYPRELASAGLESLRVGKKEKSLHLPMLCSSAEESGFHSFNAFRSIESNFFDA